MLKKIFNEEKINKYYKFTMFFLLGSFLGCVFETLLCYLQRGYFESRRGLIYGPLNPVYGLGAVVLVYFLENKKSSLKLFLNGAFLGGIIEYMCSWVQETVFNTLSWDYHNYPLNFDGRTSVYHMVWWGIFSLLFMKFLYPKVIKLINKVKQNRRALITICVLLFLLIDILISGYASLRQEERNKGIMPSSKIQEVFDKYYPDSYLDKIYPNRKNAKKKRLISERKKMKH